MNESSGSAGIGVFVYELKEPLPPDLIWPGAASIQFMRKKLKFSSDLMAVSPLALRKRGSMNSIVLFVIKPGERTGIIPKRLDLQVDSCGMNQS